MIARNPDNSADWLDPKVIRQGQQLLAACLRKPVRPLAQFATEEIILPRGPHRGQRYRLARFPAARLWFDLLDARQWLYYVATGPTQSGKTLNCFTIPIMYALFERREDVIVGLPHLDMANDKWVKDIKPAIEASRYRLQLPQRGEGSRGGKVRTVKFSHGPTLTFMSFGGDDKARAGETAPNVIITETDGGDEASTTSDESNPIDQLCARAGAFDLGAWVIMECTVSTTDGATWSRYQAGTASRIIRPCPHCDSWVTPERPHFRGWREAENEVDAGEQAAFHCPDCERPWTDQQRFEANDRSRLVHRGQEVAPDGEIVGQPAKTRTLGFRWSAVDNPFRSSAMLGSMEWAAVRERDRDNATKRMDQFQYAVPWQPPESEEDEQLDPYAAASRIGETRRGIVPADHEVVTVGVDLRKRQLHWVAIAWQDDGTCRVIDYGIQPVHSDQLGAKAGILAALRHFRDELLAAGFRCDVDGRVRHADQVWIDAGYQADAVHAFVVECNQLDDLVNVFRPCVGRGSGKQYRRPFAAKTKRTKAIPYAGEEFYFSLQLNRIPAVTLVVVNADHWKTFVHDRLKTPVYDEGGVVQSGAMSFFISEGGGHSEFCRHLAAEYPVRTFVPDKGEVTLWHVSSRTNHWFDATYLASTAARFCGVEVAGVQVDMAAAPAAVVDDLQTPDGRQFFE